MSTVQEIEKAISNLKPDEIVQIRIWLEAFEASSWDRQFEKDAISGSLDTIADNAISDFKKGERREL